MFMNLIQNGVFVLIAVVFTFVAKIIADKRTTKFNDDYEIEENSNIAIGLRRAGLYLGIFIGLAGALAGGSKGFIPDLKEFALDGVIVLIVMFIVRAINDAIILKGINNDDECQKGNIAVGLAELGNYIAVGFILNGAFTGEGGGFASALVFVGLGEIALLIIFMIYQKMTKFDVVMQCLRNNAAAGVAVAGNLIALGLVLRASIAGPFVSWKQDIVSFLISAVCGIVGLIFLRILVDKIFLPHTNLETEIQRDQNVAALCVTESLVIGSAIILSVAI